MSVQEFPVCPVRIALLLDRAPQPASVYYARLNVLPMPLYKIGYTRTGGIEKRFDRKEFERMTLLAIWHHAERLLAHRHEQEIIKDYAQWRYAGPDVLREGNTELFFRDILGLDDVAD